MLDRVAKLVLFIVVCAIASGCSVDLTKLRVSSRDSGADDRLAADAGGETAASARYDLGLSQDGQAAGWSDGRAPVTSHDGGADGLLWSSVDSLSDGATGTSFDLVGGGDDGAQTDVNNLTPVEAGAEIVGSGVDSSGQLSDAAALTTDLVSEVLEPNDTIFGAVDASIDMRESPDLPSGTNDLPNAPVDSAQGRDLGSDFPVGTFPCPTTINGSLDDHDLVQIGRHSRLAPASTCGTSKAFPGNSADAVNTHLYDVFRFHNPSAFSVCFNFTLTYTGVQLYAAAYNPFTPTDITTGYLGDVGASLDPPQNMGITVAGGATIEVVVYAVAKGTASAGAYSLSCTTP